MKKLLVIVCAIFYCTVLSAQNVDKKLTSELQELVKGFNGTVGIYVKNLKTGKTAAFNADTIFPTASMIKVPITIGLFNKINSGALKYDSILTYKDSLLYEGEDILGSFKNDEKVALSKVAMLMITTSDNTASLWCQSLAGKGSSINEWLATNGFQYTRVNSRTPGREANRKLYGWGQTTPREMGELLVRIRRNEVISPSISERIYRNMIRIYWDGEALSQIPPYIQAASKQGAVDQSRSEVVLVNAPHGDYVFCIITKNQKDQSWQPNNEGYVLIRKLSSMLWNYFEPNYGWKPAEGSERFY